MTIQRYPKLQILIHWLMFFLIAVAAISIEVREAIPKGADLRSELKNLHDYTLRMIEVPDAVGLALFTILGIQVAAQQNLPWLVTILMGVISATFGGVLRDIVCGEKPQLFFDHKPYAVIAFLGGLLYVGLMTLTNVSYTSEVVTFAVIVFLRLFSLYRGWSLFKTKL